MDIVNTSNKVGSQRKEMQDLENKFKDLTTSFEAILMKSKITEHA